MSASIGLIDFSEKHGPLQNFLKKLYLSSSQANTSQKSWESTVITIIGLLTGETLDQEEKTLAELGSLRNEQHSNHSALTYHTSLHPCSFCKRLTERWPEPVKYALSEELEIRSKHFDKTLALTRGARLLAAASVAVLIGIGASIPWMATAGVIAVLAAILYMRIKMFVHRNDPIELSKNTQKNLNPVLSLLISQR